MQNDIDEIEDRRKFLLTCGRFAMVTPPTIVALLSTSLVSTAVMASGGRLQSVEPAPPPSSTTVNFTAQPLTVGSPDIGGR